MNPHLITSARPPPGRRGQRRQQIEITEHPGRLVEAADEVLALGGVDAGLAADRGVDHAEHAGRHGDQLHPAQPGGRNEAGEVRCGATAEADTASERVKPALPSTDQQWAATSTVLAASASGTSIRTGSSPAGQQVTDPFRELDHGRRVDHRHPLDPLAEQSRATRPADRARPAPRTGAQPRPGSASGQTRVRLMIWSTTSAGVRSSVSTDSVAHSAYSGSRSASSLISRPRTLPSSNGRAA